MLLPIKMNSLASFLYALQPSSVPPARAGADHANRPNLASKVAALYTDGGKVSFMRALHIPTTGCLPRLHSRGSDIVSVQRQRRNLQFHDYSGCSGRL